MLKKVGFHRTVCRKYTRSAVYMQQTCYIIVMPPLAPVVRCISDALENKYNVVCSDRRIIWKQYLLSDNITSLLVMLRLIDVLLPHGTGSYPCPPQGWQLSILLVVR